MNYTKVLPEYQTQERGETILKSPIQNSYIATIKKHGRTALLGVSLIAAALGFGGCFGGSGGDNYVAAINPKPTVQVSIDGKVINNLEDFKYAPGVEFRGQIIPFDNDEMTYKITFPGIPELNKSGSGTNGKAINFNSTIPYTNASKTCELIIKVSDLVNTTESRHTGTNIAINNKSDGDTGYNASGTTGFPNNEDRNETLSDRL